MGQPSLSSPTASAPAVSTSQAAPTRPMRPRTAKVELDSYPRPPRGGRPSFISTHLQIPEFLSTPSARRATMRLLMFTLVRWLFLSTPSARRATCQLLFGALHPEISIHALREEGDALRRAPRLARRQFLSTPSARRATQESPLHIGDAVISIHALREEGDAVYYDPEQAKVLFLSTPSARRATRG